MEFNVKSSNRRPLEVVNILTGNTPAFNSNYLSQTYFWLTPVSHRWSEFVR